ncbi:MAG: lysylphosphatidylglycerol synthase transmembrane domain-containing protein [Candidatus Bipolaricaulia bacterium]
MKGPLRTGWKYALSVVIGFGLLAGVLYFVGWRGIFAEMHALGTAGILGVVGNVLLAMAAWILCWRIILSSYGIHIPFRRIVGARMSGYAVSYLTPTLYFGGEPFRALLITDCTAAPTTRIFATIIVERFLGGMSMILFILVGGFYASISPDIPWEGKRLLIIGTSFITFWILVGLVNFAGNFKWISRAIRMIGRMVPRWSDPMERAADKVTETEDEVYNAFTSHWKATLVAFLVQILATFFIFMRPQVFFHFSSGIRFSFPQLSLFFSFNILLSSFLWITPGGLGTGEAGMIGIFRFVAPAVPSEGVVAYSLIFKFAEAILVAVGVYYLFNRGIAYFKRRRRGDPGT